MPDPLTMGLIAGGGQALSSLGNYFGGSEDRRLAKILRKQKEWQFGEGRQLYAALKRLLDSGSVISPTRMRRMRGRFKQQLQPTIQSLMARTTGMTDLRSPEATRLLTRQVAPLEANFMQELEAMDLTQLQELRRMLLSSTFGG